MAKEDKVLATTREFERIKIIHEHIKNQEYPSAKTLTELINSTARTEEERTSIATTYRDLDKMKDMYKAPIKNDYTRKGYYYASDFILPLLSNVTSDQMTILTSAKTLLSHYEGTPLYNDTLKILDSLTSGTFQKDNSLLNRIALTPAPKININSTLWEKITKALKENLVLKFDYNGRWKTSTSYRMVHPYQLLLDNGVCFLWGYDENASETPSKMRLFNLSRMHAVGITNKHFDLPEDYEFEKVCGGGKFGAFHTWNKELEKFKIEFYGIARAYVRSCIWADDQVLEEDDEHDTTTICFSANQFNHILGWILEQGGNAKPIEPKHLVDEWTKEISTMAKLAKLL